jgi:hypothetical protein
MPAEPISKLEAAGRQLDQAILLFFSGGDSVSIHSLTLNAFEISVGLARRKKGAADWLELMREDASSALGVASKKEFFSIFNRARNFFKHVARDAEETLPSFSEGDNDFALALTVFQFGEIAERTMPMWAYLVWFYATHPEFPVPERLEDEVAPHRTAASLDRAAQLAIGRAILRDFSARLAGARP